MPLINTQNKILASKSGRIILSILVVVVIVLGCVAILKDSYDVHSKLVLIPDTDDNLMSLINYSGTSKEQFEKYTVKIDQFLNTYNSESGNIYNCDDDRPPKDGQACDVNLRNLGPCGKDNYYSYHKSAPCVFLKLKKNYHWEPKYLNASDLPEKMPEYLKNYITSDQNRNKKAVWVSCEGENDVDKENIGPMSYFPSSGFPYYYFPYTEQPGYLEPLIAVHFERPTRGIAIFIKCQIWTQDSSDFVKFALYLQ
jgi:sodium/potassium-transporting ATPase subunit beta